MKRFICLLLAAALLFALTACTKKETPAPSVTPTMMVTASPEPSEETTAATTAETSEETANAGEASGLPGLSFYTPVDAERWLPAYRSFLSDSFDVIAALWPDGISGIGFIDLDLDGMPELLLFDMGASAAMGVQIFDLVGEQVVCISSVNEGAAAAFGGEHFSAVSVCAQLFEDFRLVNDGEQSWFLVHSANGTPETSWEEFVRFGCDAEGVLTLRSLCRSEIVSDVEADAIIAESYSVDGESCDAAQYAEAEAAAEAATDLGYGAFGVFQWNDPERYDTSLDGLLVMLDDAAAGYTTIAG